MIARVPVPSEHRIAYRPDIDGLRAVAVLLVVGYHAFPYWLNGGFIGVDIFFVISGFLISSIIFQDLGAGSFRFTDFYGRRIRRIFPALIIVVAACLVAGWFVLLAGEYEQLGKHVAGGAGFIANFLLWNESNYFDNAAETKPLLHLWSLGVEEQFYIIWPLLLWLAWKRNFNARTMTAFIVIMSFALTIAQARTDMVAAFYSPATRFWELLCGALLANPNWNRSAGWTSVRNCLNRGLAQLVFEKAPATSNVLPQAQGILGGGLLLAAVIVARNPASLQPVWGALAVLGAVLVIAAGSESWLNRRVLASKPMVWVGLISYPLYLWHWPLLSFARIMESGEPTRNTRLAAVAISFVMAWLTWQLAEIPARRAGARKAKTAGLIAAMIIVAIAGGAIFLSGGVPSRQIVKAAQELSAYDYFNGKTEQQFWGQNSCYNEQGDTVDMFRRNGCEKIPFPGGKKVFLIGDSHAAYLSPGLRKYLAGRKANLFQYTASFCVPMSVHDPRERCDAINQHVLDMVQQEKPDLIILFANYMTYQNEPLYGESVPFDQFVLQRTRDYLRMGARQIVVLGQIPTWDGGLPDILLRRFLLRHRPAPERTFEGVMPLSRDWDERLRTQKYPGHVVYVSLRASLCNNQGCRTTTGPDLKTDLLVHDYGHLTLSGADFVTRDILAKYLP